MAHAMATWPQNAAGVILTASLVGAILSHLMSQGCTHRRELDGFGEDPEVNGSLAILPLSFSGGKIE